MFARGCACVDHAPIPGYLENPVKSNHSRTYKSVFLSPTIPALTQGVVEVATLPSSSSLTANGSRLTASAKSNVSPTYALFARKPFISPTYAKTGGYTPCGKCRRADILTFSSDFSRFFSSVLRRRFLNSSCTCEKRGHQLLSKSFRCVSYANPPGYPSASPGYGTQATGHPSTSTEFAAPYPRATNSARLRVLSFRRLRTSGARLHRSIWVVDRIPLGDPAEDAKRPRVISWTASGKEVTMQN